MQKLITGVPQEVRKTDFLFDKLSDHVFFGGGSFLFKKFEVKQRDSNATGRYEVFKVDVTNTKNGEDATVLIAKSDENEETLKKCLMLQTLVDFEDCVVGHYVSGNGDFSQNVQNYKAEKIITVDPTKPNNAPKGNKQ